MAIVKMKKFTLFAFEAERKRLLEELQRFGYVNFSKSDPIEEFDPCKEFGLYEDLDPYEEFDLEFLFFTGGVMRTFT